MRTVYAMVTTNCNLGCPHCDIKNDNADNWVAEAFINQLNAADHNIIFGGEPSLYMDRVKTIAPYRPIFYIYPKSWLSFATKNSM